VTTKKPKTGGEIDSYCTKCKLDLGHRIIAMVGDVVKRVECRTCGSHHNYRKPKSEKSATSAAPRSSGSSSGKDKTPTKPRVDKLTAAQRAERDQVASWEQAIAGKAATAFKPYQISTTFNPGELVRHSKFGDGVVARVIDRGKVEVLFQDGPRTMAHGQ
jgi:hypothetical protein